MGSNPQVRMANDVARQFAHLEHEAAVAAVAAHLVSFWDPRMLEELRALLAAGGAGLDPLARDAAARLPAG